MRDASAALWKALGSAEPLIVVLYEHAEQREELLSDMRGLAPEGLTQRHSSDLEDVFREPSTLLFLVPEDEREAVLTLEGRREAMLGRTAPAVLLLIRGGDGVRSLAEAPGLASWVAGNEVDPYRLSLVDVPLRRQAFKQKTGLWPEEWLREFRAGRVPDTLDNNLWATHARLLEEPT